MYPRELSKRYALPANQVWSGTFSLFTWFMFIVIHQVALILTISHSRAELSEYTNNLMLVGMHYTLISKKKCKLKSPAMTMYILPTNRHCYV